MAVSSLGSAVRFAGYQPAPIADDVEVARVRLFQASAWMLYRPDLVEHERRQRCSVGALCDIGLLDALMDLPARLPVGLQTLSKTERRRVRRLDAGIVEWADASVTRLAVPPLTPLLAVVTSNDWQRGLERASRFARYCPRVLVTRSFPPEPDLALSEASWYGIGVVVGEPGALETVVEPEPVEDWHPTPAWWQFCEKVYRQLHK